MIITRTPFRITLGGGGTDLPAYYSRHGGFAFSAGIDKYMFINVNRPIVDELIRVKYTKTEIVDHRDQLQHDIAREAMRLLSFEKAIEIISLADVPAGTGLGSSSCYTVCLLNALHALKREYVPLQDLAEEACDLEINILKKPIGKQDQYLAAFGGLTVLEISKAGKVEVRSLRIAEDILDQFNQNILLFYTDIQREAGHILLEQSQAISHDRKDMVDNMHHMKEIGYKVLAAVESGDLTDVGLLFEQHWQYKKRMSTKISTPHMDEIYQIAKANGALGGKMPGAGGGGFFMFYIEKEHIKLRRAMQKIGLKEMRYHFDHEGTKVLVNLT